MYKRCKWLKLWHMGTALRDFVLYPLPPLPIGSCPLAFMTLPIISTVTSIGCVAPEVIRFMPMGNSAFHQKVHTGSMD